MVKKLLVGLFAAVALTACNDEKEDIVSSVSFPTMNLLNPANPGEGKTPLIAESMYTFRINYTQLTGDVTMSGLNVNGITYGFVSPSMRVSEDNTYFNVSSSEIPLTSGGVVNNFKASMSSFAAFMPPQGVIGSPNFKGQNIIVASYTIDTSSNDYIVWTFPIDCVYTGITTPRINGQVTENTKDILYRVLIDPKSLKADIYVYNAKFSPSPNEPVKNFVIKGLPVIAGWGYYSIEGKDVVPVMLGEETPNPKYTFKDFKLQTEPGNISRAKIEFNIPMGEHMTYSATFEGVNRVITSRLN